MKINLNEIFYSIQGEGRSMGKPILFIRLSGCNLRCDFCDTKYHTDIKYTEITPELDQLLTKHKDWCITGGEPLLQQEKIIELMEKYNPNYIEIETNGTVKPFNELLDKVIQWNISPKNLEHNKVKDIDYKFLEYLEYIDEPIQIAVQLNYIIKFVYANKNDEKFIEDILNDYYLNENNIYIMPEGATKKEQEKNMPQVINYCLKNNFIFTPRLHVLVWNNKKGV